MTQQAHALAIEATLVPVQNKQRHPRKPVSLSVQVYVEDGDRVSGELVNLSIGGVMFRTESWIEPGSACRAEFTLPDRTPQAACNLQTSVTWCETGSTPDCFWVGCCITDLPFSTRAWLNRVLAG